MTFRNYIQDNVLADQIVESVTAEELDVLIEGLDEMVVQLDEIAGLGKISKFLQDRAAKKEAEAKSKHAEKEKDTAEKLKKEKEAIEAKAAKSKATADKIGEVSKKADEKVTAAKEAIKDKAKDAKVTAVVGTKLAIADAKASVAEKKAAASKAIVAISGGAKKLFQKMYKNVTDISEDQKKTLADLETIYTKLAEGKTVSGSEAIKVIAAVLSGSAENGSVPSFKAYTKKLELIRTLPGISSFKFSAKAQ